MSFVRKVQDTVLLLAVAAAVAAPAQATTLRRMSLEGLGKSSDSIVVGEVVEAYSYWNQEGTFILTGVRVAPVEVIQGQLAKGDLTITLMGGTVGDLTTLIVGGAELMPGRSYVLFLGEADLPGVQRALTVRGHCQGAFEIVADEAGGPGHQPGQPPSPGAVLQAAMAAWTNVSGVPYVLNYAGTTTAGWATDGQNTILWAIGNGCTVSDSCLALTALVLQAGQVIVESDITFNAGYTWNTDGTDYDTQAVATHELGHSLGLHHTEIDSTPRPTMYAIYFGVGGRTLESDDQQVPNRAVGYRTLQGPGGPPLPGGPRPNTTELGRIGGSAGGGYSTAPDLLKFATALREHRLLSAAMTETVLTGKVPMPASLGLNVRYGYGFGEEKEGGHHVVGHSGGFPGVHGQLDVGLDDGTTLMILSNVDARIPAIRGKIRKLLAG